MDINAITDFVARTRSSPYLNAESDEIERIRSVVAATFANGNSAAYIRQELSKFIHDSDKVEDIIYTELTFAASAGIVAFGLKSGAVAKEWQSLPKCCDECSKLDGKKVKIGGKFSSRDATGHPPLHVRCGCGIVLDY